MTVQTLCREKIVRQMEFISLHQFIEKSNNFFLYFIEDGSMLTKLYRITPAFVRFQTLYPDLEQVTTEETTKAYYERKYDANYPLPYALLFESYKKMSPLVFVDDPQVARSNPCAFLTR